MEKCTDHQKCKSFQTNFSLTSQRGLLWTEALPRLVIHMSLMSDVSSLMLCW